MEIGSKYIADIGTGRQWIRYSDSNEGEPNYYRDYYDDRGNLIYCCDEIVEVTSVEPNSVWLKGEFGDPEFNISISQFEADFIPYTWGTR